MCQFSVFLHNPFAAKWSKFAESTEFQKTFAFFSLNLKLKFFNLYFCNKIWIKYWLLIKLINFQSIFLFYIFIKIKQHECILWNAHLQSDRFFCRNSVGLYNNISRNRFAKLICTKLCIHVLYNIKLAKRIWAPRINPLWFKKLY